jgi:vancomycin aglycone glucosyltransferase
MGTGTTLTADLKKPAGRTKETLTITVSALGSRGDVHPILEVASSLRDRGHRVTLLVPPDFREDARQRGFEPVLYQMEMKDLANRMKDGLRGLSQVMQWFLESASTNTGQLLEHCRDADILLTSSAETHAPTVAEIAGIPHYRVVYAPWLPGDQTPPLIPVARMPVLANRAAWWLINEGMFFFYGRPLNRVRAEYGLEPIKSMLRYLNENCRTLLAVNSYLSPPMEGWNWDHVYTGPCLREPGRKLDRQITDFLESGPLPIYIGFGSMNIAKPERFLSALQEALEGRKTRVILSRGWQNLKLNMPGQVLSVEEVDHSALFPRVRAVCHHGGSGTVHMAARAGVPQFIMPHALDQYYWGRRIGDLGLGPRAVPARSLTAGKLARALDELENNPRYARRAREASEYLEQEQGIENIVCQVEEYISTPERIHDEQA